MPKAELRHVHTSSDGRPAFEVFSEPWGAPRFAGPPDRDWDDFAATEDSASYSWRGGPDILAALATAVVEGRMTVAQAANDARVSWWFEYVTENFPEWLLQDEEEDPDALSDEVICRRLLDGIRDGSLDIDRYDGKPSYYFFEWGNYVYDAAHALELPEWADRDSFEGGGPGSGYEGWHITLDAGKTLRHLQEWLYDPAGAGAKQTRPTSRRRPR
jgi:hypothetical protein